ncbi:Putative NAD(P)-binding domain, NAD(P)-binding domain superfamily [Colletotrichum destructivum]|uniref:NAD(P)-binding domain, NAD(P)-binding domain superfamily n=1 Tax=Colletotrichum destructivum TaxID=34406 RepID=A0AAX4IFG0_9PEZI|nr:Putative NAD(P)-binding domain, NAD(P)-binding domain superfamily [Colletotrichum destructivum]
MHVLILGATGRNGALVLAEALERGHTVTALVRDPSAAALAPHPNLTLVKGSPLSLPDLRAAMRTPPGDGPDAIVVALNARRVSDSPFAALHPDTPAALVHDSVRNALEAMRDDDGALPRARKLVVNSMQGAGASNSSLVLPLRVLFNHSNMKHTLDDHNAVDALVRGDRGDGVDWVLVRPPMLTEGESLPVKVYGDEGSGVSWVPKITRRSVAGFMVDAIEKDEWNRGAPVITN